MSSTTNINTAISKRYFETTARFAHAPTREYYGTAARQWHLKLRPWLPRNKQAKCVDLACGCGELLFLLESLGYTELCGVDLSAEELRQGKEFVRAPLVEADIVEFLRGCPSGSVDVIFALNILEHLPKGVLLDVLIEVRRVLVSGGQLIAMVPNAVSSYGSLTRHWDITHEWAFSHHNFRQLAAMTGMHDSIEFRECGPVPHGIISGIRFALWQIIRCAIKLRLLIELADLKGGIYTMDMLVRLRTPEADA